MLDRFNKFIADIKDRAYKSTFARWIHLSCCTVSEAMAHRTKPCTCSTCCRGYFGSCCTSDKTVSSEQGKAAGGVSTRAVQMTTVSRNVKARDKYAVDRTPSKTMAAVTGTANQNHDGNSEEKLGPSVNEASVGSSAQVNISMDCGSNGIGNTASSSPPEANSTTTTTTATTTTFSSSSSSSYHLREPPPQDLLPSLPLPSINLNEDLPDGPRPDGEDHNHEGGSNGSHPAGRSRVARILPASSMLSSPSQPLSDASTRTDEHVTAARGDDDAATRAKNEVAKEHPFAMSTPSFQFRPTSTEHEFGAEECSPGVGPLERKTSLSHDNHWLTSPPLLTPTSHGVTSSGGGGDDTNQLDNGIASPSSPAEERAECNDTSHATRPTKEEMGAGVSSTSTSTSASAVRHRKQQSQPAPAPAPLPPASFMPVPVLPDYEELSREIAGDPGFFCSSFIAACYMQMGILARFPASTYYLPGDFMKEDPTYMPWLAGASLEEPIIFTKDELPSDVLLDGEDTVLVSSGGATDEAPVGGGNGARNNSQPTT